MIKYKNMSDLSLLCADTVVEKVLEKGAQVLYNAYLKPKLRPHIVSKYTHLVSVPSQVKTFLLIVTAFRWPKWITNQKVASVRSRVVLNRQLQAGARGAKTSY